MFNLELDVGSWSIQQLYILCPKKIGYLMVEHGKEMLIILTVIYLGKAI